MVAQIVMPVFVRLCIWNRCTPHDSGCCSNSLQTSKCSGVRTHNNALEATGRAH